MNIKGGDFMEEYILNINKEEFDSIKYALSIAQLQLRQKANISAIWGNVEASEAYKEQSKKMEKLLEDVEKMEEDENK